MYIDRYEYDENDNKHQEFLMHYKNLCEKHNITPIPKVVFYGIEDATVAIYRLDSGIELSWGCPWCESSNESELISYYINKNHFTQQEQEQKCIERHQKYLNNLNVEDIKVKINEIENSINEIQSKQKLDITKETGNSLKIILMRLQSNELQEVLNTR